MADSLLLECVHARILQHNRGKHGVLAAEPIRPGETCGLCAELHTLRERVASIGAVESEALQHIIARTIPRNVYGFEALLTIVEAAHPGD